MSGSSSVSGLLICRVCEKEQSLANLLFCNDHSLTVCAKCALLKHKPCNSVDFVDHVQSLVTKSENSVSLVGHSYAQLLSEQVSALNAQMKSFTAFVESLVQATEDVQKTATSVEDELHHLNAVVVACAAHSADPWLAETTKRIQKQRGELDATQIGALAERQKAFTPIQEQLMGCILMLAKQGNAIAGQSNGTSDLRPSKNLADTLKITNIYDHSDFRDIVPNAEQLAAKIVSESSSIDLILKNLLDGFASTAKQHGCQWPWFAVSWFDGHVSKSVISGELANGYGFALMGGAADLQATTKNSKLLDFLGKSANKHKNAQHPTLQIASDAAKELSGTWVCACGKVGSLVVIGTVTPCMLTRRTVGGKDFFMFKLLDKYRHLW